MAKKNKKVWIQSEYRLAGTLTIPDSKQEKHPAILIIPGTGGSDRDGNNGGINMNLYKDLADLLTEMGFITLRYDKRGSHESEGDAFKRGFWDMVDDGAACISYLKNHPLVDANRVIALGHSEGTLIVPAVHTKEPLQGMMLLSGGASSMKDIVAFQRESALNQLDTMDGLKGWLIRKMKVTEKAKVKNAAFDEKLMKSSEDYFRFAGKKFPAKWMREHFQYNVSDDLEKVSCPVFIAVGTKDTQVQLEDFHRTESLVKGDCEAHVIPNMTHILKHWDGDISPLNPVKVFKKQLNEPIEANLASAMNHWLTKYFKEDGKWSVNL